MANFNDYTKPNSKVNAHKNEYSDLDILFIAHPISGDITSKKDSDAIKRSVRNILLTNHYERPFKPNFGANLRSKLFELDGPGVKNKIRKDIEETLSVLEPRIGGVRVDISDSDSNSIDVRVSYVIKNGLKQSQVEFKVSRVR